MKIHNLRKEINGNKFRVLADVQWEDCSRSNYTMFFEITGEFGKNLCVSPHAFLLGGIIPALHFGEKRVQIEGNICPELIHGLNKVMQILNHWYRTPQSPLVNIEPKSDSYVERKKNPHSAFFFSGGIDSYAILRENRLHYPQEHPRYFRDGILVFGLELDDLERFNHVVQMLEPAAKKMDVNLISVSTNLYLVFRTEDEKKRFRFWIDEFGGAGLAAVAHALSELYTDVSIAGNCEPDLLSPWGTHPILDPSFSSQNLMIRHEGISSSRLGKTRLISDWEPALTHLRVCNRYRKYTSEQLNCGRCEKCLRTMLELMAVDALKKTNAFPKKTVLPDEVRDMAKITNPFQEHFYIELLEPLKTIGREDLSKAIRSNLKTYWKKNKIQKQYKHPLDQKNNQTWKKIIQLSGYRFLAEVIQR
jgi:hypothetical protein